MMIICLLSSSIFSFKPPDAKNLLYKSKDTSSGKSFKSKILKDKWSMVAPLCHVNFFSKKSVKIIFMKSGFETLVLKDVSLVDPRRLVRNLLKLPFKGLKDIIFLKFNSLFQRFGEFFMNCLDLINGDQLIVVGKKIQK